MQLGSAVENLVDSAAALMVSVVEELLFQHPQPQLPFCALAAAQESNSQNFAFQHVGLLLIAGVTFPLFDTQGYLEVVF